MAFISSLVEVLLQIYGKRSMKLLQLIQCIAMLQKNITSYKQFAKPCNNILGLSKVKPTF